MTLYTIIIFFQGKNNSKLFSFILLIIDNYYKRTITYTYMEMYRYFDWLFFGAFLC